MLDNIYRDSSGLLQIVISLSLSALSCEDINLVFQGQTNGSLKLIWLEITLIKLKLHRAVTKSLAFLDFCWLKA